MADAFTAMSPAPDTGAPSPPGLDAGVTALLGGGPAIGATQPDYSDDAKLLKLFEDDKRECLDARWVFERVWWRNLLYVLGRQWIYYDRRYGWRDKRLAKWMPRPVTNKMAEGVEALLALFSGIKLSTIVRPVGGDVSNVAAAEVADEIEPFIHEEHDMDRVIREHDFWLILTGNAFLHPCWDKNAESDFVLVKYEQCAACGAISSPKDLGEGPTPVCPQCQATTMQPAPPGPDGQPQGDMLRIGRGCTLAISPWEIAIPPSYTRFKDTPKLIRMSFRQKDWYETHYPELAKRLSWETSPTDKSLQLFRNIATMADVSPTALGSMFGGYGDIDQQGKSEYELWRKPSKDWPDGLRFKVVGDGGGSQIVRETGEEPGPLPYQTPDGKPLWNWHHTRYQPIGGRLWARGPLELVVQKQDQINQVDSMIQLCLQRTANPVWLEPKGAEVRSFTGEPGLVVRYNALASNGAKPERIPGEAINPSLFQLRQQYLTDFEQLMGTFDVIKGAKPTGVEAFSALQLLVERSQSRFATVFAERGEAYRTWFSLALELERAYGPTERVVAIVSPNAGWTYQHFENADLQGVVSVLVEDGTQAPKTNLGRRAAIEQASQLGMINPMDPEQRYNILTSLGLNDLVQTLDVDVKSAKQEQDAFETWASDPNLATALPQLEMAMQQHQQMVMQQQQQQQAVALAASATGMQPPAPQPPPPPPELTPFVVKEWHDPSVHYAEHRKWANSDRAREIFTAAPILEQFFSAHLQAHQAVMQQQQAAAVAATNVARGGGGGGPMAGSNRESGDTGDRGGSDEGTDKRGPE